MIDDHVPAAFERFVAAELRAERFVAPARPLPPGTVTEPLSVPPDVVKQLAVVAARHTSGLPRAGRTNTVVWTSGDSELLVAIGAVDVQTLDGVVVVSIPVRCDQSGAAVVHVTFAVGRPDQPAGLYAATQRRPQGPAVVIDSWGEALVAYAWSVVLQLVNGLAGAAGRDAQGSRLIAAQLQATANGLSIVPMARHRFAGAAAAASAVIK
ncbi:MAG TPA: hypothetical protein VGF23_04690 [Gaiellaceae bacterium]|jgi:hypothetical protein